MLQLWILRLRQLSSGLSDGSTHSQDLVWGIPRALRKSTHVLKELDIERAKRVGGAVRVRDHHLLFVMLQEGALDDFILTHLPYQNFEDLGIT